MFHKVFPTLVAEFDLTGKIDNDTILKKMAISGFQMHGTLNKGVSSYLGGYDCALTRLAMTDLSNEIQNCIDDYCIEAGLERNFVINSWCNELHEGGNVKRHKHDKSILSGAYYPVSDADDCSLIIENPNTVFKMTETKVKETDTNIENIAIPTAASKLVIWPSYLHHWTQKNGSIKRHTISFNTLDHSYVESINIMQQRRS
jgi:uncharacterized protein (TIGR02466 family)